jgi:hypothetical protein
MNMIHGTLVVDPAEETASATAAEPVTAHLDAPDGGGSAAEAEAADMAERRAEIAELTRRVIIGALLTAPVLFAVMAHELFGADWVPALLLNHWVQLALITTVMFYSGWPIHRIGWLALVHRSAEMNSLFSFEYFQRRRARGGRMPGQWVDVGARGLIDGTAVDPRGPTRRPACKCPLCSAGRLGLRCGSRRNDRCLAAAHAVGWLGGAGRMGRCMGGSCIRRHLDRTLHLSPVEVSIKRILRPRLAYPT